MLESQSVLIAGTSLKDRIRTGKGAKSKKIEGTQTLDPRRTNMALETLTDGFNAEILQLNRCLAVPPAHPHACFLHATSRFNRHKTAIFQNSVPRGGVACLPVLFNEGHGTRCS